MRLQRTVHSQVLWAWRSGAVAALWAMLLAVIAAVTGLAGGDVSAAAYRVALFSQHGFTLWDSQWYGGHWLLAYSLLYAPVASLAGITLTGIICVGVASWAVDRLLCSYFKSVSGHVGALVFATGTVSTLATGQLPYLLGETLALTSLLAASRKHWPLAWLLAVAASSTSPLAGAFLALAGAAWLLKTDACSRVVVLILAAATPGLALDFLFPGQGYFRFLTNEFVVALVAASAFTFAAVFVRQRVLAAAGFLYVLATVFAYVIPSSLGGNILRLGITVGAALTICLAWQRPKQQMFFRALLALAGFLFLCFQWLPTASALLGETNTASTHASYYQPLLRFLHAHEHPLGRVEVVPTALRWESDYVALQYSLARGWERQLDTADNPIFYRAHALTPGSYRRWLLDNGVRFVAVPDAALDYAGRAEKKLVLAGVPGLHPVWHSLHWRVYAVAGAPGILDGDGELLNADGGEISIEANAKTTLLIREHYTSAWKITQGVGTISRSKTGWIKLSTPKREDIALAIRLSF